MCDMYYIVKVVNDGYGDSVKELNCHIVDIDMIKESWVEGKEVEGFNWNLNVNEDGNKMIRELKENWFIIREYEDVLVGVGFDKNNVVENMLRVI